MTAKGLDDSECSECPLPIEKLKCQGFRYGATSWFKSYLCNRKQVTVVEGYLSLSQDTECGVPRGSVLGPLLFVCYVNDLQRCCLYTRTFVYVDDTALLCTRKDPDIVEGMLQSDTNVLSQWSVTNKLSVDVNKTKVMCLLATVRNTNIPS